MTEPLHPSTIIGIYAFALDRATNGDIHLKTKLLAEEAKAAGVHEIRLVDLQAARDLKIKQEKSRPIPGWIADDGPKIEMVPGFIRDENLTVPPKTDFIASDA